MSATKCSDKRILNNRPAHELNDAAVTLRAGAVAGSQFAGGASVRGGSALRGYVWAVAEDKAVVDFGHTSSRIPLRVIANVADLERVDS